jgi:outer membrane immunogenic protein
VRGRLGFTTGPALFYVTGGVAFADVNNSSFSLIPPGTNTDIVDNTTRVGWTIGGGMEYMFAPHWTVRAEGRYVDLGKSSFTYTNSAGTYRGEFRNSLVTGLLGLAYKF